MSKASQRLSFQKWSVERVLSGRAINQRDMHSRRAPNVDADIHGRRVRNYF